MENLRTVDELVELNVPFQEIMNGYENELVACNDGLVAPIVEAMLKTGASLDNILKAFEIGMLEGELYPFDLTAFGANRRQMIQFYVEGILADPPWTEGMFQTDDTEEVFIPLIDLSYIYGSNDFCDLVRYGGTVQDFITAYCNGVLRHPISIQFLFAGRISAENLLCMAKAGMLDRKPYLYELVGIEASHTELVNAVNGMLVFEKPHHAELIICGFSKPDIAFLIRNGRAYQTPERYVREILVPEIVERRTASRGWEKVHIEDLESECCICHEYKQFRLKMCAVDNDNHTVCESCVNEMHCNMFINWESDSAKLQCPMCRGELL